MAQLFVPTRTFDATVYGSRNCYMEGYRYTVYDTPQHKELAQLVQKWSMDGLVTIVGTTEGAHRPTRINNE